MYTIGKLALRVEVNANTVRHYEKESLLAPAKKDRCRVSPL